MIDFSREYAVVRTGSKKTVSMRVENGSIVIRCPKHLDKYYINNIYLKHRSRLLKKLEASKDGGAEIRLFGKNFKIEKNYSGLLRRPSFEIKKDVFIENLPIDCKKSVADASLRQWKIDIIRKILIHKTLRFNKKFNFHFDGAKNHIFIKEQKSLWGSCSHSNNLNFNYKIIEKDNRIIDYLVLHELTHTIHKNHSAEFWNELARALPNYRELKKKLREN